MQRNSNADQLSQLHESPSRSGWLEDSLVDTLEQAFPEKACSSPALSTQGGAERDSGNGDIATLSLNPSDNPVSTKRRRNPIHPTIAAAAQRIISSDHSSARSSSSSQRPLSPSPYRRHLRSTSSASRNQSSTSLRLSPKPGSGLSSTPRSGSVRSLALSDEDGSVFDECGSQAIHSSSEDEDAIEAEALNNTDNSQAGAEVPLSIPQLVMPSLSMPKRRPFTDRGNRMGRLKVMVMGPSGVGKTCLIHSILQSCDDVVHVDHNGSGATSTQLWSLGTKEDQKGYLWTSKITETTASTKAYPAWWSEMDEVRGLKRRRSTGGAVLDRNICFIDTPGWDNSGASEHERMQEVAEDVITYIEEALGRNSSLGQLQDSEVLGSLSGGGGFQVDAVLYVFRPGKFHQSHRQYVL